MKQVITEEALEQTQKLIQFALAGDHFNEEIRHLVEYRAAKDVAKTNKKLAKAFRVLADQLFAQYLAADQLSRCQSEFITSVVQLQVAAEFYQEQYKLITRARRDYIKYLFTTPITQLIRNWPGGSDD